MPRDARKYLFDIAEASKLVSEFVAGKTLDDYLKSALLYYCNLALSGNSRLSAKRLANLLRLISNWLAGSRTFRRSFHSGMS